MEQIPRPVFSTRYNGRMISCHLLLLCFMTVGCSKNEPIPVAGYSYKRSPEFKVPCTVAFTNQSSQSSSFAWWFGADSSLTTLDNPGSTTENPSHIYRTAGTYRVTLRAYSESGKEWASMTRQITIGDSVK